MTQDQDQRGPGYVVRGDVVPENETDEYQNEQAKPMTRFQKVASALRGGTERDERDSADEDMDAERDAQARHDYWDEPTATDESATRPTPVGRPAGPDGTVAAMDPDVPVEETNPDVPASTGTPHAMDRDAVDHPATEPDIFGTTTRPVDETDAPAIPAAPTIPAVPAAEDQPGAATIADARGRLGRDGHGGRGTRCPGRRYPGGGDPGEHGPARRRHPRRPRAAAG